MIKCCCTRKHITQKDIELTKKLLETRVRELYVDVILPEHNLDKLFKTSLVSIPDDKLLSTQRDEYFQTTFINGEPI